MIVDCNCNWNLRSLQSLLLALTPMCTRTKVVDVFIVLFIIPISRVTCRSGEDRGRQTERNTGVVRRTRMSRRMTPVIVVSTSVVGSHTSGTRSVTRFTAYAQSSTLRGLRFQEKQYNKYKMFTHVTTCPILPGPSVRQFIVFSLCSNLFTTDCSV